jgi:LEA14-like dessication related protein
MKVISSGSAQTALLESHPMFRIFRLSVLSVLATLLLAGCASLVPRLDPPQLSVIGVEWVRGDLFEQRFKARLRVQNPNDRAIAVRGVSYTLEVGGEELGRGLSGSSFTVPALGEAEFDMLVTANFAGTLARLLERARSNGLPDSLSYRLRGEVKLAEGLVRTIPFDEKGSVRLR